ncbi:MAG: regulator protein pilR [Ignavibacteriae bacterium]|nr:MAG: regulator protein pilR [Ignavibacteriota bacterium]
MNNYIKTILIAEEDQNTAQLLVSIFQKNKFNVGWVQDCDSIFEALVERNVDLALIDLSLAYSSDKISLISHIKAVSPDMEIIIMTDFRNPELLNHALLSGASVFVQKPIDPEQLILMSVKTLEKQHLKRENYNLLLELAILKNQIEQFTRNQTKL